MKVRSMTRRHLSLGTEMLVVRCSARLDRVPPPKRQPWAMLLSIGTIVPSVGPLTLQRVYIQETVNFCVCFAAGNAC
jgi:hypothetical protein